MQILLVCADDAVHEAVELGDDPGGRIVAGQVGEGVVKDGWDCFRLVCWFARASGRKAALDARTMGDVGQFLEELGRGDDRFVVVATNPFWGGCDCN